MDLNQDGYKDILSGCAKGPLNLFAGDGKGGFAESQPIRNDAGEPIILGFFTNVCTVDWNGDGILDLLTYATRRQDPLQLLIGKGDLRYEEPIPIETAEGPFEIGTKENQIHDARVHCADWNGDGIPDLILGNGVGSITLFLGSRGPEKTLRLGKGVRLVEALPHGAVAELLDRATMELKTPRSWFRPTVSTTDWNGDGKLDLLVGDLFVPEPERRLTPEELEKKRQVEQELNPMVAKLQAMEKEAEEVALRELGKKDPLELKTGEEKKAYTRIRGQHLKSLNYSPLYHAVGLKRGELSEYIIPTTQTGYVWVYLRK